MKLIKCKQRKEKKYIYNKMDKVEKAKKNESKNNKGRNTNVKLNYVVSRSRKISK